MKFVSIDVETSGLNPDRHKILQLSAILVDTKVDKLSWPTFNKIVNHDEIIGQLYAINLNKHLIERILNKDKNPKYLTEIIEESNLYLAFYLWLSKNLFNDSSYRSDEEQEPLKIIPAGKNFVGFDKLFINKLPEADKNLIHFSHRTLDPGSMYVTENDIVVPNLEECKKRSGIFKDNLVTHDALDDAMDVAELIVHFLNRNEKR